MVTKEGQISNIMSNYFTEITWNSMQLNHAQPQNTIDTFKNHERIMLAEFHYNQNF